MRKNRTKTPHRKAQSACGSPASPSRSPLREADLDPRAALMEVVLTKGFEGAMQMLEQDRERLCGPLRRYQKDRLAHRYGFDDGSLVFGGRKVKVSKPRVRSVDGHEVELPTWNLFAGEDPLDSRVMEQLLVGVSTRSYDRSLEELPEKLAPSGVARSSVSRRFVAMTQKRMEEFLARPLGDLDLPVIMLDGRGMGEHLLVIALGIDSSGKKHVLGVVEGSTESTEVCRNLLRDLIGRGLVVEQARLFVIDGGKGIRRAIHEVFGSWVLVQRCQIHKLRNVADHLPKGKRTWVKAVMRRAWALKDTAKAKGKLRDLARQLEGLHPGAAGSILEGLEETMTVIDLHLNENLLKTLSSTNAIENVQGTLARVSRNVKRWRGGSMALRWGAAGLLEAEKKFRRLKGYREMPQFIASLEAIVAKETLDSKERVA